MIQLFAALVAGGILLTIFTGPFGLVLTVPAAIGLFLALRARQGPSSGDHRAL